jgi:hypothetical protein
MNARTPIEAAVIQIDLLDFGSQTGIFSAVLRGFAVFPARIAAFRHFKRLTEHRNRILLLVFCDELKFYAWTREKMPIASDRISLNLLIFS